MPQLPETISATLKAIHANRAASRWTGRGNTFIPASEAAAECARAVWYGFHWASPPENASPRMLRLFGTGHMEEQRILSDLAAVPGVSVWPIDPDTGKQWRGEIEGFIVVKPDAVATGLPEAPKSAHVVECKTANDKTFGAIKSKRVERGKPEHWLQMQLEMLGQGLKRALYFVVNKNTDEEYVERVRFNAEATHRAVARLVGIAKAPRPPGKFRDDAAKPPCLFCRHKGICHDGALARVHCRTCLHSTPGPGGMWRCERWNRELTPEAQAEGCPAHLFIPDLVPGEQIDAAEDSVTYRMPDGQVWVDGAGRAA